MKVSAYPVAALGGAPSLVGVQSGATRRFPAAQLLGLVLQPAGGKSGALGGNLATQLSDGSSTSSTYRHAFRTPVGVGFFNPEVVFSNWYVASGQGDFTPPPNAISIKATLEFGSNFLAPIPLYFGGRRTLSLDPGANVRSDPVGITIAANTQYFVRVYVSVAAGGKWPLGRTPLTAGAVEGNNGANGADVTDAYGTLSGGTVAASYGPTAVVGHPTVLGMASVGVLGDSLAAGTNETAMGPNGEQGWLEKRLAANLPWITHTRGGLRLADFVTGRHARSLAFFTAYCTSIVCELGSNDLYADGRRWPSCRRAPRRCGPSSRRGDCPSGRAPSPRAPPPPTTGPPSPTRPWPAPRSSPCAPRSTTGCGRAGRCRAWRG